MTNEQINRLVAEDLGWTNVLHFSILGDVGTPPGCDESRNLPDFCNDYNAAAEIRKGIRRDDEQVRFAQCLSDLTFTGHEDIMPEYYWTLLNATPRQQAEAFLRLRGKWREGNPTRDSVPVCKHCLSDPCECCDADVSPDMGAK